MTTLIRFVLVFSVLNAYPPVKGSENSPKFIIIGAGAAGISTAARLLENGFNNIVILEAENRIGGRVHTVPFGKGFIDLGAQWCQGETGNVVYELVHEHFEFGDTKFSSATSDYFRSDGNLMDRNQCAKLIDLLESYMGDYSNMAKFNRSVGDFYDVNFQSALQDKEFEDVDRELADQIKDLCERRMNAQYASDSWFDISTKLNSYAGADGNPTLTWREHGYKILFDFLTKKRPDPSKALSVDDKIQLNKEVTKIDWNLNQATVQCADGTEYRADHVIVTVSLGFLKKHHRTLFTPQLPEKKVVAIENTGYGTLGKIFLEFEEPFWPTDIEQWSAYMLLWKQKDKDNIIGSGREWLIDIVGFLTVDAQPNLIGGFVAGKHLKQFEEIDDQQLIDDCMWLLEKFLGRTLPRPINMGRSHWMSSKYFLGSYSFASMDAQAHNVVLAKDLAETIFSQENKPIILIAGEATDENYSGYVHGAVASGYRAAGEIFNFYSSSQL